MKIFTEENLVGNTRFFDLYHRGCYIKGSIYLVDDNSATIVFRIDSKELSDKIRSFKKIIINMDVYSITTDDIVNKIFDVYPEDFI
jgi:virulence-associated protein VapD